MRWNSFWTSVPASSPAGSIRLRGHQLGRPVGLSTPETGKSDSDIVLPYILDHLVENTCAKSSTHGVYASDQRLIVSSIMGQIFFSRASPVFVSAISRRLRSLSPISRLTQLLKPWNRSLTGGRLLGHRQDRQFIYRQVCGCTRWRAVLRTTLFRPCSAQIAVLIQGSTGWPVVDEIREVVSQLLRGFRRTRLLFGWRYGFHVCSFTSSLARERGADRDFRAAEVVSNSRRCILKALDEMPFVNAGGLLEQRIAFRC